MIQLPNTNEIAYLVHDIQNDSHKSGGAYPDAGTTPGTDQYLANHAALLAAARNAGIPIVFTGHWLRDDYADVAPGGTSQRHGALKAGTWGAEIVDELTPLKGEWVIRKGGGYSAFTGTPLDKWLHRLGVSTIIVAGTGTQAGVAATLFAARDLDYATVVVSDACRGGREAHDASMLIFSAFCQVGTTEEVVAALESLGA